MQQQQQNKGYIFIVGDFLFLNNNNAVKNTVKLKWNYKLY